MKNAVPQHIQEYLSKDENIVWIGQPNPSILFTKSDWFVIPFSVFFSSIVIFMFVVSSGFEGVPFPFSFVPIFLLIFGFHLLIGRFIVKSLSKKQTYYVVTNKRILSSGGG